MNMYYRSNILGQDVAIRSKVHSQTLNLWKLEAKMPSSGVPSRGHNILLGKTSLSNYLFFEFMNGKVVEAVLDVKLLKD